MTQVSWKKPLSLAAALLVLGTTVYYLEFKRAPEKEEAQENAKKPLALKDASVATVRVVDGQRRFAFRCLDDVAKLCKPGDNSKWEMSEPLKAKADDSNVNALVSALNAASAQDTIDLKEEQPDKRAKLLKEYRLDTDARKAEGMRRVEITTGKGEARTLYLGDTHPVGEAIFAGLASGKAGEALAFDENRVLLLPTHLKGNFDHDLTYWRDKRLLSAAAHEIRGFKLDWAKAQVSGERSAGEWTIRNKGAELAGDLESIDSLVNAATYLAAKHFVSESKSDPAAKKALAGARKVLTLTLETEAKDPKAKPAPITLVLLEKGSEKAKKLYATVSTLDPLYELEPSSKDRLSKELKDLRMTKLITSMDRFTAKRLELSGPPVGAPALVLTQAEGKWSAEGGEIDGNRVQTLLDKLSGNRIQGFLEGGKIPAGQDKGLRLALGDEKEPAKRDLVFWQSGDRLLARDMKSKRSEAFEVDRVVKDALPWARTFFKKAEPKPGASAQPPAPAEPAANPHGHGNEQGHAH